MWAILGAHATSSCNAKRRLLISVKVASSLAKPQLQLLLMTLSGEFQPHSFGLGRRGGLLSAAFVMISMAAPATFGQAPSEVAAQARVDQQGAASLQAGSQNSPAAGSQADDDPPPPDAGPDRRRLAVNPLTGLITSSATNYEPLTAKERWKVYWKQNYFSIGAYFGPVFTALVLDQSANSPPQWGGGVAGFGLRVASRTVGGMIQGTVQAPLAAVLHEDVRYISSPQHGFKRRAFHALEYSVLTYNAQGHTTLNVANLGAYYTSTAISTAWLPDRKGSLASYTLSNGSEQIALSVPVNLLQEFWPEITRMVLRRHPT